MGSLVVACELLVAACMSDLVPLLGIEPICIGSTGSYPRDHQGSAAGWNLKGNLSSLGPMMHYEALSGILGLIQGWAEVSQNLWELEDTLLCVWVPRAKSSHVFTTGPQTPQCHTQNFDIGTKQFIVQLPFGDPFETICHLNFAISNKLPDLIIFQEYQNKQHFGGFWLSELPICVPLLVTE